MLASSLRSPTVQISACRPTAARCPRTRPRFGSICLSRPLLGHALHCSLVVSDCFSCLLRGSCTIARIDYDTPNFAISCPSSLRVFLGMSHCCESLHCPAYIGCVCNGERNLSTVFPRYSALPPRAPRGFSGSLCYDDMPSVHAHKQCDKRALLVSHPCDARKFCIVRPRTCIWSGSN